MWTLSRHLAAVAVWLIGLHMLNGQGARAVDEVTGNKG